ncbi:curli production assembly/transport protein CsgE [Paralcaligenes sp. KSB-10]|uniref:curli production assembly/transport protein CsgE n=1 Tax=Paralcaligenes sp. KSB-10 TaxID=2901142 RepID=UPI001E3E115A|nr:curli production assembly/transport protein CsgE [Paralcaligenes sp. KSB-10]UHL64661.1 curli production assembly/transport protein CsgE [Paralcaligenes sp. KSB-10]
MPVNRVTEITATRTQIREKKVRQPAVRLCALVLLLTLQTAYSKSSQKAPAPAPVQNLDSGSISDEPLGGVVINRTVTVLGWDFYKNFAEVWRAKYMNTKYTVTVYERPTAQYGSEVWVQYRQNRVFHTFLSPARSAAKEISGRAVDIVYKNVVDTNVQRLLFNDVDLGPEEM